MASASQLFAGKTHAALYSNSRPLYPAIVYKEILNFVSVKLHSPFELALDVGCGNGQGTAPLAPHFKHVIATDVSESQVAYAKKNHCCPNITFQVGSAEKLEADDKSVELVTAFTAAHWFDMAAFLKEADRVLKPFGCLAFCGYHRSEYIFLNHCKGEQLSQAIGRFQKTWRQEFPKEIAEKFFSRLNGYKDVEFPNSCAVLYDSSLKIEQTMSVTGIMKAISTSSAYQNYTKLNPDGLMTIEKLQREVESILNIKKDDCDIVQLTAQFPLFLKIWRKSCKQ